jgi:D-alanyl-D-alanine carboxypeptidase
MKQVRSIVVAFAVLCMSVGAPALAQTPQASPTPGPGGVPGMSSAAAILVNVTDGDQILFTRNATAQRAPASLTKVMTALVARDEFPLDEVVVASPLVLNTNGSDLGLEPGMKISVRDLLYALLIKSANDSAMALAAHHPGGYEHFIQLMNEKARALGAYDTQFANPHGLDQEGHVSSARDMAIFARELLADPVLAQIVDSPEHTMRWKGRDRTYGTHHRLIRTHPNVIGMKTGFTNNAGHCLISALRSDAGILVTVVMGSLDHYRDTLGLFEYGKSVEVSQGGGGVEGFGRLPVPPLAPDIGLPTGGIGEGRDPRDDIRWALLMMGLALACAAMLMQTRRRSQPAPVDVWLANLVDDGRRRRR